jgi:mono/diheme cytochrome c family protein
VVHGRDNLTTLFPQLYSPWQNAVLPAEEFVWVKEGSDFGWPYYYYDPVKKVRILSPEYGGDGKKTGRGNQLDQPLMSFPAHWAPNDLLFYKGSQFPERYKNGAFIAFHGSNNRAPYPQAGFFLCFVPFKNGKPAGNWEVFADGFAGVDPIINPANAVYQPMGLAMGPDGSLYVSDSKRGRIWRIMYKGDKNQFGGAQLAQMEKRKSLSHIRTPHQINDNLDRGKPVVEGENIYNTYCRSCHQQNGKGDGSRYPSLVDSEGVKGDKGTLINIVLKGSVRMPQHSFLTNESVAEVLTYIRQNFGENASAVSSSEVAKVRSSAR